MIDKLVSLLDRWLKTTPKQTYKKLLEQFDSPEAGIGNLPEMLVEFWNRVNVGHFIEGPDVRQLMYINLECRHSSITELTSIITYVTNALIHDDEAVVMGVSQDLFIVNNPTTLDDYLITQGHTSMSFHDGVNALKTAVLYHNRYLENAPTTYHCRVLNRMYNDILTVTRTLIDNMKEAK
jgi:hypothetical protein